MTGQNEVPAGGTGRREGVDSQDSAQDGQAKGGLLLVSLASLPAEAILDERRLASILCVTPRTVRRMVSRFELPPAIRLAGRSVWLAGRVLAHIQSAAERAEREAEERARRIRALSP